ncbi:hypothetical protein A5789_26415 [Nocardia sp. 852002-51101_SCH5132738]|nr:hypothetical protein A5789_26415 [Nocardia sp. 852002-51101_SCH5132738]
MIITNGGVQGLFSDQEMKQVIALIQHTLSFDPGGYTFVQVVRHLLELDYFPQDSRRIVRCLQ